MPTHIRSAERFEREGRRGIRHKQSSEYKDVVRKLRLYHRDTAVTSALQNHLLVDLRDALTKWSAKNMEDFTARHGAELANEIMVELSTGTAEHLEMVPGDILFRWVPRGIEQRKILQAIIGGGQAVQDASHRSASGDGFNLEVSSLVVQHVGIYAGGVVVEIGGSGLGRNPVGEREHFDLVVRSRVHGRRIARVARSALSGPKYYNQSKGGRLVSKVLNARRKPEDHINPRVRYPIWDFLPIAATPHPGARLLARDRILLRGDDEANRRERRSNILQQRVICSHFANAVLYAGVRAGGTLATATDHAYDEIFRVSPAQMWREFMHKQGIWAETQAVFVGIQHKGNLDRNMDSRTLGVGLNKPPVPKRAGRPHLTPPGQA